jgi:hypothetical protein
VLGTHYLGFQVKTTIRCFNENQYVTTPWGQAHTDYQAKFPLPLLGFGARRMKTKSLGAVKNSRCGQSKVTVRRKMASLRVSSQRRLARRLAQSCTANFASRAEAGSRL